MTETAERDVMVLGEFAAKCELEAARWPDEREELLRRADRYRSEQTAILAEAERDKVRQAIALTQLLQKARHGQLYFQATRKFTWRELFFLILAAFPYVVVLGALWWVVQFVWRAL